TRTSGAPEATIGPSIPSHTLQCPDAATSVMSRARRGRCTRVAPRPGPRGITAVRGVAHGCPTVRSRWPCPSPARRRRFGALPATLGAVRAPVAAFVDQERDAARGRAVERGGARRAARLHPRLGAHGAADALRRGTGDAQA